MVHPELQLGFEAVSATLFDGECELVRRITLEPDGTIEVRSIKA